MFFAQDPASLGAAAGLMATLPGETLDLVDERFHDRDGRWVGTSGRVRVVVHNTDIDLPLPETIDDAVDPAWAGQMGVAPTNGSFLAFVSAMILERGEDGTRQWLEALAANDPVEFDGNAPIVEATDTGELGGGLVNHYYLLRLRAEGQGNNTENYFIPAGDVGSLGDARRRRSHGEHRQSGGSPGSSSISFSPRKRRPSLPPRPSSSP